MKAKIKNARRKASKLHGATAGFVSIVDRGANETPFKMIKSAEGTGAMGIKKRTDLAKSHKKLAGGKKEAPAPEVKTVMAKMVFSKDHFEDEQAVRDWIEKAEWDADSITVTEDGDNFVARPEGTTDDSFTKLASVEVDGEQGVAAFVGQMEVSKSEDDEDDGDEDDDADAADEDGDDDDDDEGDEEEPAAKAADKTKKAESTPPTKVSKRAQFIAKARETVQKFNGWDAFFSGENTLAGALKKGMEWDKTPPGFYDVQAAFNGVVQQILGDETEGVNKAEALQKAAADYANMLVGMDDFFDAFVNSDEDTVKKAVGSEAEKIAKWAEGYAQFIAGEAPAPATEKKAVKVEVPTVDTASIADLVAKAVAPLAQQVEGVVSTVSKIASRHPTKKSADLTDAGSGDRKTETKSEVAKTDDWLARKQRKSLIG